MKDAKEALLDYLLAFRDPQEAADLLPKTASLSSRTLRRSGSSHGMSDGRRSKGSLSWVLSAYPDMEFKPEDVTILIDTPRQAFAEYITHTTAAETGRKVHELFMGRIVVEESGQIKLLRESLNTLAAAQALLPGGAADVPAPGNEVHSF